MRGISQFLLEYVAVTMKTVLNGLWNQGYFSLTSYIEYWLAVACSSYSLESKLKQKQKQFYLIHCCSHGRGKKSNVRPMWRLLKLVPRSGSIRPHIFQQPEQVTWLNWMSSGWGSIILSHRGVEGWWTRMQFTTDVAAVLNNSDSPLAPRTPIPGLHTLVGW